MLLHPSYSPDLVPSVHCLFADLKRMLQGKQFSFCEKVISETEAYFEAKDKSFNKKDKRETLKISASPKKETMLINKVEFYLEIVLLVRSGTY